MLPPAPRTSNWYPHFSFYNRHFLFVSQTRTKGPANLNLLHLNVSILCEGHELRIWLSFRQFRPPLWSSLVRVLCYRSGGLGSIPGTTRKIVVSLEWGPLSLVSTIEELLDRKVAAPV
jgi:hypothetical protein